MAGDDRFHALGRLSDWLSGLQLVDACLQSRDLLLEAGELARRLFGELLELGVLGLQSVDAGVLEVKGYASQ